MNGSIIHKTDNIGVFWLTTRGNNEWSSITTGKEVSFHEQSLMIIVTHPFQRTSVTTLKYSLYSEGSFLE